ncbi:helix-turn-helix domain-containing protein [Flavobacterium algicola]|uniref:helix-turn-helix domain-containing protein n=1 Tax=Flavobacterium algicola TaxID=556529 RepID=UPI001EFCC732|nr:AraC family transcriptional regulator [Flavobacterium algicola]MCG9793230.1 AraC family transcriptional regulator [Flavobacterium algicola]
MKIYIKNMACESCKVVVSDALEELHLHPIKVNLGEVTIKEEIDAETKQKLNSIIQKVGLEIVESKGGILIEKIKNSCLRYVNSDEPIKINISDYLTKELDLDYNYLSNAFSDVTTCTIVHYINLLKMEKAKEMILFEEYNFSEIAEKLNFSSLSAFSTQFKKITSFTPSHFRNLKKIRRKAIQELNEDLANKKQ